MPRDVEFPPRRSITWVTGVLLFHQIFNWVIEAFHQLLNWVVRTRLKLLSKYLFSTCCLTG